MVFNSLTFIGFFAVVLALHHLPTPWRWRKGQLLVASYLFYAAWNPPFVLLLWISTVVDWFAGRWMHRAEGDWSRRVLLVLSLAVNLGMLGFFKYGEFLLENFVALMEAVGVAYAPAAPDIILPVGISFYTFQTLSYTIDIYRRQLNPWHSFLDYALYVTFFPQLVAGPIVRASEFLPQCIEPRRANARQLGWGLSLLILGLFEKVVIADALMAPITEAVYDVSGGPSMVDAWAGTFAFATQIFCDFAGYSTCAIGAAMCLGFAIPDNFRFPYAAIGFSDFWRRWHISLSTWLRDYLYIPLGGSRVGRLRTNANLMITMLLGGLWHGAAWTFVGWGALHGLFLVAERIITPLVRDTRLARSQACLFLGALVTFLGVCVTWVLFRAHSFDQAASIVGSMAGRYPRDQRWLLEPHQAITATVVTAIILGIHWYMRDRTVEQVAARTPSYVRGIVLGLMLLAIATVPGEDRSFIYFQF